MAENNPDWGSILKLILREANECTNIFERIETGRTWAECTSDWVVGDRDKINPVRLLSYVKKFKEEVTNLLSIYTKLYVWVKWSKTLELGYQENVKSKFQLDFFKEGIDAIIDKQFSEFSLSISDGKEAKEQTCKLKTMKIVAGGAGAGAVGGAVVGRTAYTGAATRGLVASCLFIPFGIGLLIGNIAAIAHYKVHSSGRERGLDYQTVKLLYDSFHKNKLLSSLQTLSVMMKQLSENVNMQMVTYKQEFGTGRQEQKNAGKELAKATKLYYETLLSEIEQLKSSEPGMGEDMRKRMATKIAANGCKTFLKQSLNYSDSDAQEFIDDLQS